MENFLRNIKLIDEFSMTLPISKSDFVSGLRSHVDEGTIDGLFDGAFEGLSSSENLFKGLVDHNGFKIRKRRRFLERKFSFTKAIGNFREQGNALIVNTKLVAWSNFMILYYVLVTGFYVFFIGMFFNTLASDGQEFDLFFIGFLIVHALFMYILPYVMMKRSLTSIKKDVEREFHYIVSKSKMYNQNSMF